MNPPRESNEPEDVAAHLKAEVLRRSGRIPGFIKVTVRQVSECCWRVNVWATHLTKTGGIDNRVCLSWFVTVDEAGQVLRSSPPLDPSGGQPRLSSSAKAR